MFTVSELNRSVRTLLEGSYTLLWIEGELSNLSRPTSGHLYFSLKDPQAQVRCALFRNRATLLRFKPADGMHVLLRARVGLYEPRGDFQLIVEHMEEAGSGALQRAFEELKKRLAAEGLFDAALKRPLPTAPRTIGVITSQSGAALRDILSVIRRRCPLARVILYPVPVQGEGAGGKIAAMLRAASTRGECDVLILARGGGSLEDLWAFNEEGVARAIRASAIPVVSGVGHEIDFTIADFAADLRAPTPSGAAELVTPDMDAWRRTLVQQGQRLALGQARLIGAFGERLDWCVERLRQLHPGRVLRDRYQRLDELQARLARRFTASLAERQMRLAGLAVRLAARSPRERLHAASEQLSYLLHRLDAAAHNRLQALGGRLALAMRALDAVSPLATLRRGYAIVSDAANGAVISHAAAARPGQSIRTRLSDGTLTAEVKGVEAGDEK
ncbi:MAG TPA: exodeoxyribonuclease VII large subunit [Gammaproteobacteria bacterium]|nr:exodeoxyribonuclease VII large subunit [Gammaproteobacteria bacterium]